MKVKLELLMIHLLQCMQWFIAPSALLSNSFQKMQGVVFFASVFSYSHAANSIEILQCKHFRFNYYAIQRTLLTSEIDIFEGTNFPTYF